MGNVIIKKVSYNGDSYYFESPELSEGLNIIEGSNRSGKSTFMNLIYYSLSGSVEEFKKNSKGSHLEITSDTNNYAELVVIISDNTYKLRRFIGSNDIIIISGNDEVQIFPIHRTKNEKYVFSDWILEKLDISVVEVFQGNTNFKINFRDLMRLIYHDQEPNPRKIYKAQEADNIISDSELVRKIIFQLLIGKTFSDYYSELAKQKEKEKLYFLKKALYEEYLTIAKTLNTNNEDLNIIFLQEKLKEKNDQLERLYDYRNSVKKDRPNSSASLHEINIVKASILAHELELDKLDSKLNQVVDELAKLCRLRDSFILEVTQIKKIIHSHDRLKLFSADTCPYCLRGIERDHGHCVCGKEIDESQYERFFYSADEYSQIFKAKQKSVDTILMAIKACENDRENILNDKNELQDSNNKYREKVKELIDSLGDTADTSQLDKVDDEILKVREEINSLTQRIIVENKLSNLQKDFDKAVLDLDTIKNKVRLLEVSANEEIRLKVSEFSIEYNKFMTNTLKDCRTAKIDIDDYMPVINNAEYREASASVSIRLMYYLTMLRMSLLYKEIKYPKFLLIDTPETAGIDSENLINCIRQISRVTKGIEKENYQIILSTALDKYPIEFKGHLKITLTDNSRLLKSKERKEEDFELLK